jgi:hypothetical protein
LAVDHCADAGTIHASATAPSAKRFVIRVETPLDLPLLATSPIPQNSGDPSNGELLSRPVRDAFDET